MVAGVMKRAFLLLVIASVSIQVAAQPRAEKIATYSGEISEKVKAALQADGYRIYLPNTLIGCEVWLPAKVPTGKNTAQGVSYPEFEDSTFLGVITFPKGGGGDFRGQSVRTGSYTMRYAVLPSD